MPSTFTWAPDYGASKSSKPRVQSVKYGDGYEARNRFGLNRTPQVWSVQFKLREQDEADLIDAFLAAAEGSDYFQWTPPGASAPLNFLCREWSRAMPVPNRFDITATFEQVFDP
jgi:phage-related protein